MAKILTLYITNLSMLGTFQLDIEGLRVCVLGWGEHSQKVVVKVKRYSRKDKEARLYLFISDSNVI